MFRRKFTKMLAVSPLIAVFFHGCKENGSDLVDKDGLIAFHDKYFRKYNKGMIQEICESFYDPDCTYVSDTQVGNIELMKRTLRVVFEYHRRNKIIPLHSVRIKTEVRGNFGWIVAKIFPRSGRCIYGTLTQIFNKTGDDWAISHDHFSRA